MMALRPDKELLVAREAIDHHAADMTATFGAGVSLAEAQRALGQAGQWLPIDGDQNEPIGKLVSYNSSGPLRLGYGAWRDLLLGVQFRNGRGELITAGGQTMKNVAGYDLTKFMVGQAGVFGTIETVTTRTYRRPDGAVLARFEPDPRRVNRLLPTDARPQWALLTPEALLCGYVGDQQALAFYEQALIGHGPREITRRTLEEDIAGRASRWRSGEAAARVSVPPARSLDFVKRVAAGAWVADAAFGIVLVFGDPAQLREAATELGGTITLNDRSRAPGIDFTPDPAQRALLERLKRSFDPDNRLAPLPWQTA